MKHGEPYQLGTLTSIRDMSGAYEAGLPFAINESEDNPAKLVTTWEIYDDEYGHTYIEAETIYKPSSTDPVFVGKTMKQVENAQQGRRELAAIHGNFLMNGYWFG